MRKMAIMLAILLTIGIFSPMYQLVGTVPARIAEGESADFITTPLVSAFNNTRYYYDANYSPAGENHFHFVTNSTWLTFDNYTGVINGTCPANDTVGCYYFAMMDIRLNSTNAILAYQNWTIRVYNFTNIWAANNGVNIPLWGGYSRDFAVESNQSIFVVYTGYDRNYDPNLILPGIQNWAVMFNKTTKTWSNPVLIFPSNTTIDDHGAINCILAADNHLVVYGNGSYAGYDHRNQCTGIWIARCNEANSITGGWLVNRFDNWTVTRLENHGDNYTYYPSMLMNQKNKSIYCFYHFYNLSQGMENWSYRISEDNGSSWSARHDFLGIGQSYAYGRIYLSDRYYDDNGSLNGSYPMIDLFWSLEDNVPGGMEGWNPHRQHVFFARMNLTTGLFYSNNWTCLGNYISTNPYNTSEADTYCRIFNSYYDGRKWADYPIALKYQGDLWVFFTHGTEQWNASMKVRISYIRQNHTSLVWSAPADVPYYLSPNAYGFNYGYWGELYFDVRVLDGRITLLCSNISDRVADQRVNPGDSIEVYSFDGISWSCDARIMDSLYSTLISGNGNPGWGSGWKNSYCCPYYVRGNTNHIIFSDGEYFTFPYGCEDCTLRIFIYDLENQTFVMNGTNLYPYIPPSFLDIPNGTGRIGEMYSFNTNVSIPSGLAAEYNLSGAAWLSLSNETNTSVSVGGIPDSYGVFNISLSVSDSIGFGYLNWSINVSWPAVTVYANFSYSLNGTRATFTDLSEGCAVNWSWSFGDGHTSYERNPSHIYMEYGNFAVNLVVRDYGGNESDCGQVVSVEVMNDEFFGASFSELLMILMIVILAVSIVLLAKQKRKN